MADLHVILATTLDGFVAAENGSLDWIIMGDERADYMVDALERADTLMLGRKTYQGFAAYWPHAPENPEAPEVDKVIGAKFNAMEKVVFSRTLESAEWEGTRILPAIDADEIRRLKAGSGKGIKLDGSISVVQQLSALRLIDEYRLMVHPVALGRGRPLFTERIDLELVDSERLRSGVAVLTYRPAAAGSAR